MVTSDRDMWNLMSMTYSNCNIYTIEIGDLEIKFNVQKIMNPAMHIPIGDLI